ncbi:unnamed protein product, partial [Ectocarpus sp. 12 AP-2014]
MSEALFHPVIETTRLALRPLVLNDSRSLLDIFSDPAVMRYWNTTPWTGIQDALDFVNRSNDSMRRQESLILGICL